MIFTLKERIILALSEVVAPLTIGAVTQLIDPTRHASEHIPLILTSAGIIPAGRIVLDKTREDSRNAPLTLLAGVLPFAAYVFGRDAVAYLQAHPEKVIAMTQYVSHYLSTL